MAKVKKEEEGKKRGKKKFLSEEKTSNLPLISRKYYGLEIGF
jgi:putative heme iron utilization protein